jgi:hypothetical protein
VRRAIDRGFYVGLLVLAAVACSKKPPAIAELKKADGPVEKQTGEAEWGGASVGTKFFIGDAARTADGGAQLEVAGGAQIAMQPHTILRFGGKQGNSKIAVELGAIDLTGTGSYGLDVGDVRLSKGTLRITAKSKGQSTVELVIGDAQVSDVNGKSIDLVIGEIVDLAMDVQVTSIDAGVAVDAGVVDAPMDAPEVVASDTEAAVEIAGNKAEILNPGEKDWKPLPAGAGLLAKGAKLRLGAGTTAKLTSRGTTLDMAGGSRAVLGDDLSFSLETGSAKLSSAVNGAGKVTVPGGTVAVKGTADAGGEAKLDVTSRETRVNVQRATAKLTGATGGELEMNRGETATLAKNGTIRVVEAIPTFYDFKVPVGETITIHDPKGTTAVKFSFGGKCGGGGFIEMDRDSRYRTAKVSAGKDDANLSVVAGGWAYRLRCSTANGDSAPVASGRIVVTRDSGNRALPKQEAVNDIDADGRNYRISYQSVIPTVAVKIKGEGGPVTLHVATGGKEETFPGPGPKIKVPGSKLKEGTYTYWIDRGGVKDPKVSTLTIDFDNTAPQVYISSPVNGRAFGEEIEVKGAVLPGWTAAVDMTTIPIDSQRRFTAKVQKPSGNALAIKLSHPQRGIHYYLRRGK